jgi:hypothetical protein
MTLSKPICTKLANDPKAGDTRILQKSSSYLKILYGRTLTKEEPYLEPTNIKGLRIKFSRADNLAPGISAPLINSIMCRYLTENFTRNRKMCKARTEIHLRAQIMAFTEPISSKLIIITEIVHIREYLYIRQWKKRKMEKTEQLGAKQYALITYR